VWLVTWKKHTGRPAVTYDDAVSEALAFGWVDSKPAKLDADRTMLYFSPRRPGSAWSRPNKQRVQVMESLGLMADAGSQAVHTARTDGSWSRLDDVENLVVPADLAHALERHPGAESNWDAFPRSTKRGILEWIVQARRAETRASRVEDTAARAARGERANQWHPKREDDEH
jgi:uncharacterized protein YdeI (YjbR/CyaY-like superfamily)